MTEQEEPNSSESIVAKPANLHRGKLIVVGLAFFFYGLWSIYDGFVKYPRENSAFFLTHDPTEKPPHPGFDVPINQGCGVLFPLLGFYMVSRALHRSRGSYKLANDMLSVPGHPDVPLSSIKRIDKRLHEKKGIVSIDYELTEGRENTLKLDDFYYDRENTVAILARIEQYAREQSDQ